MAGLLGGFMTGILATVEGCAAFGLTNPGGAIAGNGRQVWVQLVGALFIIGWNLAVTPLILFFIKYVLRVPLKFNEATLTAGDDAIHGEEAYVFDGLRLLHDHDGHVRHAMKNEEPTEKKSSFTPPNVHVAEVVVE